MDPYCLVKTGTNSNKTRVHEGAGMQPVWNDSFKYKIRDINTDKIKLQVFDEETIKSDDLVGGTER